MRLLLVLAGWLFLFLGLYWISIRLSARRISKARLKTVDEDEATILRRASRLQGGWLHSWLSLAGYRKESAPWIFLGVVLGLTLFGGGMAVFLNKSGWVEQSVVWAAEFPGGFGDIFQPVLAISPWIFFFMLAAVPWVVVRTKRRRRVLEIEQDLPSILELLATLSQAGMGFDAALGRVLLSQQEERTLAQELRLFQLETLAGVPRIRAFRRLSDRVRIPYMSTFVGAMVQAEQTGAGLSTVLRIQAQELRNRRREKALVQAESLPVKLTFPLVICFLPAVFIVTLGPAFHSFFQVADSVLRSVK